MQEWLSAEILKNGFFRSRQAVYRFFIVLLLSFACGTDNEQVSANN